MNLAYRGHHSVGAGGVVIIVVLSLAAFCLVVGLGIWRSRQR